MDSKDNSPAFTSLKGQLLLAMPQMNDPRFHRAVIFMGAHDPKGSMGMVINNPLPSPDFSDVLRQVGVTSEKPLDPAIKNMPVMAGGPVEGIHGFCCTALIFHKKTRFVSTICSPSAARSIRCVPSSTAIVPKRCFSRWVMPDGVRGNWKKNCRTMSG